MIEDNAGYNAQNPQLAISGSNVVVVWEQSNVSAYRIYSNYSTDGGVTWDPETTQLIEDNAVDGFNPQVVISGSKVVAVWEQYDGSAYRIYSNYSTDGGVNWNSDQLIENNAENGYNPQIAVSGDNAVAVWRQYDGSVTRIYSNYSTDGGVTWDPETTQLIEDNTGYDAGGENPQIAISGDNAVAVWPQYDGNNDRIYSNYSTDGGATWNSDQIIEDNAGHDGYNPQVTISGYNVIAVWYQDYDSNDHIYSNYSTDGGATWSSDQLIEDNTGYNAGNPQIAISGNNVVVVWDQLSGSGNRIYSNYAQMMYPTADSGSLPVGPLAAGISAFLVWWKRRRQKQG